MPIEVKEARTEAERLAIYQLRYRVYVDELKLAPRCADHERRLLAEPLDAYAHNFYATADGEVLGTVRGVPRRDGPFEHEVLFDLDQFRPFFPGAVSMTTKLVIAPGRRASTVLKLLVLECYRRGRQVGIAFDFLDCWPHLITLYEHLGYRRYKSNINHPEAGYMTPMVLVMEDLEHLRRVGSPLAETAASFPNAPQAAELFAARFPTYAAALPRRLLSPEDLWQRLSENVSGKVSEVVPLFREMTQEEIQEVLAAGNIVNCRWGDRIITQGETRQEFYTLLTGQAEVSLEVQGRRKVLATLDAGETFGEMAFLADCCRSADVFALADGELLVHDARRLAVLEQRNPGLATKLFRNLARVLAFRLLQTSRASGGPG
jgi:hypothetical protein